MSNLPAAVLAARMHKIEPFHVMDVQSRADALEAQGRRIIRMEIGQPDFSAPAQVIAAAGEAMRGRALGYTAALGIPELRQAISDHYRNKFSLSVPPERIVVTTGASGAFMLLLGVLLDAGRRVLMPDPCYPCNRHFVTLYGGHTHAIPVDESQAYQLSPDDVKRNWDRATRGIILASPSNPTGTLIAQESIRQIAGLVRERGGFTIVDEIYQGLVYGGDPSTALTQSEDVFVVNSFSKYFCMTGWRLGWIVAPLEYVRAIEKLAQNAFICPPAPAQYAALAAFQAGTLAVLEARRREFERRRDLLVPALREMGFRIPLIPGGAFYIYAGCEAFSPDSAAFAMEVLQQAGVAITPGLDFGMNRPERYVRFAYTRSFEDMQEAVNRLSTFLSLRHRPSDRGGTPL